MELFFFLNDFNIYELYEMDENEIPDEELPRTFIFNFSSLWWTLKITSIKDKIVCFEVHLNNVKFFNGFINEWSPIL